MEANTTLDSELLEDSTKVEIELTDSTKFILLYVLSFGLYGIWWMYKGWRFFKEKESLDILPAVRAIFAIFFMYSLLEKIQRFAKSTGWLHSYASGGLVIGFVIANLLARLPEPYWFASLISFLFFIQPVNAFNFAIENSGRYKIKNDGFNGRQIALVIVGGIWWILILLATFVPPENF
jgi:hypothetical protein